MDFYEKLRQILVQKLSNYNNLQGDSKEVMKAKKHLDQDLYSKKKAKEELSRAYANQWTDYKNQSINDTYYGGDSGGTAVGSWARVGKMFDDDGNIVDIDYDYYSTVPYSTLKRVFQDGADDVRRVINERKAKYDI